MILTALGNHLWQSTLFAAMAGLLTLVLRKFRRHVSRVDRREPLRGIGDSRRAIGDLELRAHDRVGGRGRPLAE